MSTGETVRQLVVDDGIFTNGLRITYFAVWAASVASPISNAMLSRNPTIAGIGVNQLPANDPAVFAWAYYVNADPATNNYTWFKWSEIDPDHVANEELYLHNPTGDLLNYIIVAEPYIMSEDEGVLQLVKGKQMS